MGRRTRGSAGDLMDIIALLPWWAGVALGVALGVAAYLLLHWYAGLPLPVVQAGKMPADFMGASLFHALAFAGQFAIPFICLLGAIASAVRRRRRQVLLATTTAGDSVAVLGEMTWQEFEALVAEGFRARGFSVTETGGPQADGGVDMVLTRGTERFLVQCKQWKAFKVGVTVVRELYGVMAARGAAGGYVVTSGRFTTDAISFAEGRNIVLLDGPELMRLLKTGSAPSRPAAMPKTKPASVTQLAPDDTRPACPSCARPMMLRTAKRGPSAGSSFWGCSDYPGCKGTRPA
jgi:restriction system protein